MMLDEVDHGLVLLRQKTAPSEERRSVSQQFRRSMMFVRNVLLLRPPSNHDCEPEEVGNPIGALLTLKILLIDIPISLGDCVSDLAQAYTLYMDGKHLYGAITFGINWIPGLIAAIHLIAVHRHQFQWYMTLFYAFLLILFYPLVPTLALIGLLWSKNIEKAEYKAVVAHAIRGTIESPIQLIYQLWLAMCGVVELSWGKMFSLSLTDWEGNTIYLPLTAGVCIAFSILSILKAVLDFNTIRIHIESVTNFKKYLEFCTISLDYLPYLASSSFFRITAIVLNVGYLNSFGFFPTVAFWLLTLMLVEVRQRSLRKSGQTSVWLTSFASLFVPAYFSTNTLSTEKSKRSFVDEQKAIFRGQSILACLCYLPPLLACAVMVNMPYSFSHFTYNQYMIFNNIQFNVVFGSVMGMGLTSAFLSWFALPTSNLLPSCQRENSDRYEDTSQRIFQDQSRVSKRKMMCVSVLSVLVLGATFVPVYVPWAINFKSGNNQAFVYFMPMSNNTRIIRVTSLAGNGQVTEPISGFAEFKTHPNTTAVQAGSITDKILVIEQNQVIPTVSKSTVAVIMLMQEPHRPSSPLPDVLNAGYDVPLFLLRASDREAFTEVRATSILGHCGCQSHHT